MNRFIRTLSTIATASALLVSLAACSGGGGSPGPTPSPSCPASTVASNTKTRAITAVLEQQGSGSSFVADHQLVLDSATKSKDRTIVNAVGPSGANAGTVTTVLRGDGENDYFRKQSLACRRAAVDSAITVADVTAKPASIDTFDSLAALGNTITGTGAKTTNVVIFGSGLTTSGSVTTSAAALKNPAKMINGLAAGSRMPTCKGWKGYVVTGTTSPLDPQVRELFREYFQRCGGQLVFFGPHLTEYPLTSGALAAADTSQVTTTVKNGITNMTIPADVLFSGGDWNLLPSAVTALGTVADTINAKGGVATVTGATDIGGTDRLGMNRATAVVSWLLAHGTPSSALAAPQTVGDREPVFSNPETPAQHAANRRVIITLRSAS